MNRYVTEELMNIAMARRNGESLYEPLREYEQKKMEKNAIIEYETQKMNCGLHFTRMQIADILTLYKNGEIGYDEMKVKLAEIVELAKNSIAELTHIDKFEKQRALENLVKSLRKQFV